MYIEIVTVADVRAPHESAWNVAEPFGDRRLEVRTGVPSVLLV